MIRAAVAAFVILFFIGFAPLLGPPGYEHALVSGLLMAPQGIGAMITMPIAGQLTDRMGVGKIVLPGMALIIASFLALTQIGAVINGTHKGRSSAEEITLFDGTGVGLQDLAVAAKVVELAKKSGKATDVAI